MAQIMSHVSPERDLSSLFFQDAWVLIVRGLAAVIFGLTALFWPGIALSVLVALFGIYACLDGALALVASFRMAGRHGPWMALLLEGIVGITVGIIVFRTPGLAAIAMVYVVAAWAIITGCIEIAAAFELRKFISGEWALGLCGLLSVVLGWLLFAQPLVGIATLVWLIGLYALFFGGLMAFVGIRLRRHAGDVF